MGFGVRWLLPLYDKHHHDFILRAGDVPVCYCGKTAREALKDAEPRYSDFYLGRFVFVIPKADA